MPPTSVRIHGLDHLDARLRALGGPGSKAAARRGLERGAQIVARRAKELAPVRTGALRESIAVGSVTPDEATVAADVEYAACVEYGTERMAAQPYLRPALDESQAAVTQAVAQETACFTESGGAAW